MEEIQCFNELRPKDAVIPHRVTIKNYARRPDLTLDFLKINLINV